MIHISIWERSYPTLLPVVLMLLNGSPGSQYREDSGNEEQVGRFILYVKASCHSRKHTLSLMLSHWLLLGRSGSSESLHIPRRRMQRKGRTAFRHCSLGLKSSTPFKKYWISLPLAWDTIICWMEEGLQLGERNDLVSSSRQTCTVWYSGSVVSSEQLLPLAAKSAAGMYI